jgi:hypothetical protein
LGGCGLLGSGLAADGPVAGVLGLALYGAVPGVAGLLFARRLYVGGRRVLGGLIALQGWLIVGGIANIGGGSLRGFSQLLVPVVVLWLLTRAESRAWFDRPDRPEPPARRWDLRFSLPRMITWRRDTGQSTVEFAGLVVIIAGIVLALTLTGFGGRIADGIGRAVCSITGGTDCGGGGGGVGGTDSGAGGVGGAGGAGAAGGAGSAGPGGGPDGTGDEAGPEPEAEYDVPPKEDADEPAQDSGAEQPPQEEEEEEGEGEEKEDCSGWGFFGCAGDRVTQVFKGVVVDGVWGDVTGFVDLFKPETWSGIAEYGKQLGGQWLQDAKGAADKWADGDHFGAIGDWATASGKTVVSVADDVFVGDEVRERWNDGEKTRAVTDVAWNIGSLFIPGYDVAKVVGKFSHLGKAAKGVAEAAEAADRAGDAARAARKAAEAGDVEGARKAAKDADEAADRAEERARNTGCPIAGGPGSGGVPGAGPGGVSGPGTGLIAAARPGAVRYLADDGCDATAKAEAQEARKQERAAWAAQKAAEEPARAAGAAARTAEERAQRPAPVRGDTNDPRNYDPPEWAEDLKAPALGSADKAEGYWAYRDRNPPPSQQNESWVRYQEQISGVQRTREYVVPHPSKGERPVEYDGWDSDRQTFLEAKNGYAGPAYLTPEGTLTPKGRKDFLDEAQRQVDASGGRAVEWHFSQEKVADATRAEFEARGLPIEVVHTPPAPGGPRKPGT